MAVGPSRKLAVILHADIVGSTSLVRKNETLAHQRIQDTFRRFSDTISRYSGISHEIRGDALVAEFARASDAVCASIAFQEANTSQNKGLVDEIRPVIRIGISMGEVVVADNTVTGEGVVLAQRLEQFAKPGEIVIQGAAYETVPKRFPFNYDNLGELALKGFDDLVKAYTAKLKLGENVPRPDTHTSLEAEVPYMKDKPSIAVLPFNNMSADPDQDYFSDGITEDIITELSRFRNLFVIARHSSFAFKDRSFNIEEISGKLGVQYVVEGSVRKAGNNVRITVQLVEGMTGRQVWAERYDGNLKDIFAVQDEVTQAIVSTLPGRMEEVEVERAQRKVTESMTAHDYTLRGRRHWHRFTRMDMEEARNLFQRAINIDPAYGRAHTFLAATHIWDSFMGWSTSTDSLDSALESAQFALTLDDRDDWAHAMLGFTLFLRRQDDEAEVHFTRALNLNPNDADIAAFWSNVLVYLGRWEEALEFITKARRLNPFPPEVYHWYLALALFSAKQYERAIRAIKEIRVRDRWHCAYLAACLAQLNQSDEAQAEATEFEKMREQEITSRGGFMPTDKFDLVQERVLRYRVNTDKDHLLASLRKAGLAE